MERPLGVTLVAILTSLWGIFAVAGAFEGFTGAGLVLWSKGQRGNAAVMIAVGVFSSALAVLLIRVSWGLLNLRKWARTLTILLTGIALTSAVVSLIADALSGNWKYSSLMLFAICINLVALLYLLRLRVKEHFTTPVSVESPGF